LSKSEKPFKSPINIFRLPWHVADPRMTWCCLRRLSVTCTYAQHRFHCIASDASCRREALSDGIWKATQAWIDIPYEVHSLDQDIFTHWTRSKVYGPASPDEMLEPSGGASNEVVAFMHPDRLLRMRKLVLAQPLASRERICDWGSLVCEEDARLHDCLVANEQMRKGGKRRRNNEDSTGPDRPRGSAKRAMSKEKISELRNAYSTAHAQLQAATSSSYGADSGNIQKSTSSSMLANQGHSPPISDLLTRSPLARMRIGASVSSKQNYILSEVNPGSIAVEFPV
jgi:hypothetical protein